MTKSPEEEKRSHKRWRLATVGASGLLVVGAIGDALVAFIGLAGCSVTDVSCTPGDRRIGVLLTVVALLNLLCLSVLLSQCITRNRRGSELALVGVLVTAAVGAFTYFVLWE